MYKFSWVLFVSFVLGSCTPEPPQGLTRAERKIADSLTRVEMKTFRKKKDADCEALQDSLIPVLRDSMMKARIEEITKQLERIKKLK